MRLQASVICIIWLIQWVGAKQVSEEAEKGRHMVISCHTEYSYSQRLCSQVFINNFYTTRCHTLYKPVMRTEFIRAQRSDLEGPGVQYHTHVEKGMEGLTKDTKQVLTSIDK